MCEEKENLVRAVSFRFQDNSSSMHSFPQIIASANCFIQKRHNNKYFIKESNGIRQWPIN